MVEEHRHVIFIFENIVFAGSFSQRQGDGKC
jgi:hypothetical protein